MRHSQYPNEFYLVAAPYITARQRKHVVEFLRIIGKKWKIEGFLLKSCLKDATKMCLN